MIVGIHVLIEVKDDICRFVASVVSVERGWLTSYLLRLTSG